MTKKQQRVRLPGPRDIDPQGRVRLLVTTKTGRKIVKPFSVVDAREIILVGSGTLDVPPDLLEQEERRGERESSLGQFGLRQLRGFCKAAGLSFTGKPESELRRLLLEHGFAPPDTDQSEMTVVLDEIEDNEG